MNYLETSIKFYKKQIEGLLQIHSNKEFVALTVFKDAREKCEEAISETLNHKVYEMLVQLK
jgi:hypothetical protein